MAQTPVELIEALCMADAISGREEKVRELLIQKIDGHCEWRVDTCSATKKERSRRKNV